MLDPWVMVTGLGSRYEFPVLEGNVPKHLDNLLK